MSDAATPTPSEDTRLLSAEERKRLWNVVHSRIGYDENITVDAMCTLQADHEYAAGIAEAKGCSSLCPAHAAALLAKPEVSEDVEEARKALHRIDELAMALPSRFRNEVPALLVSLERTIATLRDEVARLEGELEAADATMQAFHKLRNCNCVADCMAREVGSCFYLPVCDAADAYRTKRLATLDSETEGKS